MNRMIYRQGWKVKGKPKQGVEAALNCKTLCVGYDVSVPGGDVRIWILNASGQKISDVHYQFDRYGALTAYLICPVERKLLGWK